MCIECERYVENGKRLHPPVSRGLEANEGCAVDATSPYYRRSLPNNAGCTHNERVISAVREKPCDRRRLGILTARLG